jgi:hypothetical protein
MQQFHQVEGRYCKIYCTFRLQYNILLQGYEIKYSFIFSLGQVPCGFFKEARPYFGPFGTECGNLLPLDKSLAGFLKRHNPTLGPLGQSAVI